MFILNHYYNKILVYPEVHILVNKHNKSLKSKKEVTVTWDLNVVILHSQITAAVI